MNLKKRVSLMLIVILVLQIILPTVTVIMKSELTLFSTAVETIETWDISENGNGSITAVLDSEGTLRISGKGKMKNWANGSAVDWYNVRYDIKKVIIEQGITNIGNFAFTGCKNLTSIEIPIGTTSFGLYSFASCSSLTNIEIPEGTTSLERLTFYECDRLTSILIPKDVISIGTSAFYGCSNLININVDENNSSYTSENGVLFNKDKTTLISYPEGKIENTYVIPPSVINIGDYAFANCNGLTNIQIPPAVDNIGKYAFAFCNKLTNVKIVEGVTNIDNYAFSSCGNLTDIEIPKSVTSIGVYAFGSCRNLRNIEIPPEVTSIRYGMFNNCSSLTNIVIPQSVSSIDYYAFNNCSSLTNIVIPVNVTDIGDSAFNNCSNLNIICKAESVVCTYAKEKNITYTIDDVAPIVEYTTNGNTMPEKQISTKINIEDELANINKNSLRYLWSTKSEGVIKDEISNTFVNGDKIIKNDEEGTFYLWVYAEDNLGNGKVTRSNLFKLDNTQEPEPNPTVVTLTNIKVTKAPRKTTYTEGEKFDKTGMVVTAEYSDGTSKEITNYTYTPNGALKVTDKKIIISYTESEVTKTVEQDITVIKAPENNTGDNKVDIKDESITPDKKLPQTGARNSMLIAIIIVTVIAIASYCGYKKYKNI